MIILKIDETFDDSFDLYFVYIFRVLWLRKSYVTAAGAAGVEN